MQLFRFFPVAAMLFCLFGLTPLSAFGQSCSDALSEAPPANTDYTLEFAIGDGQECLPDSAEATITAYAFDNRVADDAPITTVASWGPTPVGGFTTLRPGLRESDLLAVLEADGDLADVQYYFTFQVDLDGDGEICNADLEQVNSTRTFGGYPGTQRFVIETIQLGAIVDTPCNKTPLQGRSLDNDPLTIEAYYDKSQNITWLADANLGASQSFGLNRGNPESGAFSYQITDSGQIESKTIEEYRDAMNATGWLGQSNWRLPTTKTGDTRCTEYVSSVFFESNAIGTGCRSEMGNLFLAREQGAWLDGDFLNVRANYWSQTTSDMPDPTARYNFDFTSGAQSVSVATGSYGPLFHLWFVHDGDIGDAVDHGSNTPANEGGGVFWWPLIGLLLLRREYH